MKANFDFISHKAPKAFADLLRFYTNTYQSTLGIAFVDLPYAAQVGILWEYFIENGIEWDLSNLGMEASCESLEGIFETYENTMGHFS